MSVVAWVAVAWFAVVPASAVGLGRALQLAEERDRVRRGGLDPRGQTTHP